MRRAAKVVAVPVLAWVMTAGCGRPPEGGGVVAAAPDPGWSPASAEILYSGRRGGVIDLYLQAGPEGEPVRLTDSGFNNGGEWSPDGARIAFQSQRDGNYEIYRMNADGSEQRNLTRSPGFDGLPVWSPDGAWIAFFSRRDLPDPADGAFDGHLYLMNADGGEVRRLTGEPLASTFGPSDFSPDGTRILLARYVDGQTDLFALEVATGVETRLTDHPASESSAVFSPDGARLAFTVEEDGRAKVVVLDLASGRRTDITPGPGQHYYPAFSPDGRWVVTTSLGVRRQYDLRAHRADGSESMALVSTPEDEREASWRPRSAGDPG